LNGEGEQADPISWIAFLKAWDEIAKEESAENPRLG
jgi:hypothetical protein